MISITAILRRIVGRIKNMHRNTVFASMGFAGLAITFALLVINQSETHRILLIVFGFLCSIMVLVSYALAGRIDKAEAEMKKQEYAISFSMLNELKQMNSNISGILQEKMNNDNKENIPPVEKVVKTKKEKKVIEPIEENEPDIINKENPYNKLINGYKRFEPPKRKYYFLNIIVGQTAFSLTLSLLAGFLGKKRFFYIVRIYTKWNIQFRFCFQRKILKV